MLAALAGRLGDAQAPDMLWSTGDHRLLFTGDTLYLADGGWAAGLLDSSDRDQFTASLTLLRDLDFDILIPWAASDGGPYAAPVTQGEDAGGSRRCSTTSSYPQARATFDVNRTTAEAHASDYHALVIPGGFESPDLLRVHEPAVRLVAAFTAARKPIAAICHAPWVLIEADVVRGRTLTSWPSLRTDIANAGGTWTDRPSCTTSCSSPAATRAISPPSTTRLSRRSEKHGRLPAERSSPANGRGTPQRSSDEQHTSNRSTPPSAPFTPRQS